MRARIFRPAKNAMQSGKARTKQWVLEYEPETARTIDPLMGWTSSDDMRQQLNLEFDTAEEAVAYATAHAIPYQLFEPHVPTPKPKAYSDNFKFDRKVVDTDANFVPNGVAYDPASGLFVLTGKYWPVLYFGRFTPAN